MVAGCPVIPEHLWGGLERQGRNKRDGWGGEVAGKAAEYGWSLIYSVLGGGRQAECSPALPYPCSGSAAGHWSWHVPSGKWVHSGAGSIKIWNWRGGITQACIHALTRARCEYSVLPCVPLGSGR